MSIAATEEPAPYYYTWEPYYYYTYSPYYYYGYNGYGYGYGDGDDDDSNDNDDSDIDIYNDDDLPWNRMRGRNGFKGKPNKKHLAKAKRTDTDKLEAHHEKKEAKTAFNDKKAKTAKHIKKEKTAKRGPPTKKSHKQ